jgi:hypothetical protein
MWDDLVDRPLEYIISPEGQNRYGLTLDCLTGKPISWDDVILLQQKNGSIE